MAPSIEWKQVLGVLFLVYAVYNIEETGGSHRFTWWNGFLFSLYCLSNGTRWSGLVATTVTIVVLGVLIMSFMGASLLQEALDDNGPYLYFVGTWIMHYLPPAVVLGTLKKVKPGAMTGAAVFALYTATNDASDVYGADLPRSLTVTGAVIVASTFELVRASQGAQNSSSSYTN